MNSFSVDLQGVPARAGLTRIMQALVTIGLNRGAAGNASVRTARGYLISPTGVRPHRLHDDAHIELTLGEEADISNRRASSEWRFHRDIYHARPDVGAIVHVHSPHATALSCLRREIPAFHYMISIGGGDSVRCADYATFGTQALSDATLEALRDRRACLLANHGLVAVGADLEAAYELTLAIEDLAYQYCLTLQCGGATILNPREMTAVLERFKTYGQSPE